MIIFFLHLEDSPKINLSIVNFVVSETVINEMEQTEQTSDLSAIDDLPSISSSDSLNDSSVGALTPDLIESESSTSSVSPSPVQSADDSMLSSVDSCSGSSICPSTSNGSICESLTHCSDSSSVSASTSDGQASGTSSVVPLPAGSRSIVHTESSVVHSLPVSVPLTAGKTCF